MNYVSTRGNSPKVSAAYAIKNGLAQDGGLYMPETLPTLTLQDLNALLEMDYAHRACDVIGRYLTDYDPQDLLAMCQKAYAPQRFGQDPAPVVEADSLHFLELWHGPTCAFKDMALQLMPLLLSHALKLTGEKRRANILVATSGDTGKAALEGFCNVDQVQIMVLYPENGVSPLQKKQMTTQEGDNVLVCAIQGNFDDAQSAVKSIFANHQLARSMEETAFFSSANSINWGRLVPQIVYYVSAYCDLVNQKKIAMGDKINVCVPTGNFGDIFAGYLAKRMGLPIEKLICASNTNKILTDFFATGVYDKRREFYTTSSPSMDILISSNLERMLYLVCGAEKTARYMNDLATKGYYAVDEKELKCLQEVYAADWCDEATTAATVKNTFDKAHYLCDTHTAVAVTCAKSYQKSTGSSLPMVVVSTASAYKFVASVCRALNIPTDCDEFDAVDRLMEKTGSPAPKALTSLKGKTPRFTESVAKDRILPRVLAFVGK